MRKVLMFLLTFSLLLCACGKPTPQPEPAPEDPDPPAAARARAVVLSQEEEYDPLPAEDVNFYVHQIYGFTAAPQEGAIYRVGGSDPCEVALFRFGAEEEAQAGAATLEAYRLTRVGDFYGYDPQDAALVEGGKALCGGVWAALLICRDPDRAEKSLGEAVAWERAAPAVQPTAKPKGLGYAPFDPPRDFDMTLCDLRPLVAAWVKGDWSGLGEKERAVLDLCREAFAELLSPDMTQVEKELVLHDWLIGRAEYDMTHYDPRTPQGREDNNNPYGTLVRGCAVCLGYAESFRLLMELTGVECVTVAGASYRSSEDHAWNLVELDGEWYCVDPTWDDADWETPEMPRVRVQHRYFNVTSDLMRATDHQWDYENVPECTADRYRWDGTGPLPK